MKVAFVSDTIHPYFLGGKESRQRDFLLQQSESTNICEINVYTMDWWGGEQAPRGYEPICSKKTLYGPSGKRSALGALQFAVSSFRLLRRDFDLIEADQFPLLHLIPLWLVAKLKRVPLSATWHEFWGYEYSIRYGGKVLGSLYAWFEHLAIRLPDLVACAGQQTYEAISCKRTRGMTLYIPPNFTQPPVLPAPSAIGEVKLLFVGRLIEHKRVHLLLSLVEALQVLGVKAKLLVIGLGPSLDNLQFQAKRMIESGKVTYGSINFLGEQTPAEVAHHLSASLLLVSASNREGFGFSVAEALSAGVPCVVADSPGNNAKALIRSEILGLVVDFDDSMGTADQILDFARKRPNRDAVQRAFFDLNPQLAWGTMFETYFRAYQRLLESRAR